MGRRDRRRAQGVGEIESRSLRPRLEAFLFDQHLHPAVMAKEIHDFFYKGEIDPKQTVTGSGGWTTGLFAGRWLRANHPGQGVVCAYQYGAIGPDMAMMIGAGGAG